MLSTVNNYMQHNGQLRETDELPEAYNVPRLNHKERENLDRPITSKKIKLVTKTS